MTERVSLCKISISKPSSSKYKKITAEIIKVFAAVKRNKERKVKVGIVGEIYVKYSGNHGYMREFRL